METIEYRRLFEREEFYWWNIGRREILKSILRRYLAPERGFFRTHLKNHFCSDSKTSATTCQKKSHKIRRILLAFFDRVSLEVLKPRDESIFDMGSILDIGCGAGGNIKILGEFGSVTGLDISEEALKFARTHGVFKDLILGDAEYLPFPDGAFDLVSAFDVLEHVPDDRKAITEIFRVLKRGGYALITVPAHRWLWSRHDEALHHLRRYTTNELRGKLAHAGFRVVEHSHFVIPAILFLLFKKMVRRIRKVWGMEEAIDTYDTILPSWLNRILIFWLSIEKALMRVMPIPAGSSLVMIGQKP